jgi:DNA-binding Lrp family transcriptional regulator
MTLRALLAERLQRGIALVEHPYRMIASELGCDETMVLALTNELVREGYIRSFGAFIDFERLGYDSLLCGLSVPEEKISSVASTLNERHEVTHNYLRGHSINMWFTAILPKTGGAGADERKRFFEEVLRACDCPFIAATTEIRLKLRPNFRFSRDEYSESSFEENSASFWEDDILDTRAVAAESLNAEALTALTLLQKNFPVVPEPFELAARKLERSVPQLLRRLRNLEESRVLRRIGVSLHHRRMGYNANALVAWTVNNDETLEDVVNAAKRAASCPWVSHCYIRKTIENTVRYTWSHSLYTMIHALNESALSEQIRVMRDMFIPRDVTVLPTLQELKKTRYLL